MTILQDRDRCTYDLCRPRRTPYLLQKVSGADLCLFSNGPMCLLIELADDVVVAGFDVIEHVDNNGGNLKGDAEQH